MKKVKAATLFGKSAAVFFVSTKGFRCYNLKNDLKKIGYFPDIHARDEEGLTPLHYASRFKRESKRKPLETAEDGSVMQVRHKIKQKLCLSNYPAMPNLGPGP